MVNACEKMTAEIRIAIIGGGVAGVSLMHALQAYPHLDVNIFESAPTFKEAGVAFGIARNATAALSLIGPSALECLERAGGVPMLGVRFLVEQGPYAGEQVYEADNEVQGKPTTTIVQRANLLHQLLERVPEERMHDSKKLRNIDRKSNGPITIHFEDGSEFECDIAIGADRIHSAVRKIILGEEDPATIPRNSGSWVIMKLMPYDYARENIRRAPVNIEDAREYGWLGEDAFILHNLLSNGSLVQFAVCGYDRDAVGGDQWHRTVTSEQLKSLYSEKDWLPHLEKAVDELLCDEPEQQAFYLWHHLPARTYVDGPVCIVGDAAHATTPFQGSGAGMSIEDSLVLSSLLGRATSPREAVVALEVYDQVRRTRTQKIVESSWQTARIFMALEENTGLDAEKLRPALLPRWDFIIDHDNKQALNEAIKAFDIQVKNCDAA